jgi:hypothetical protein
MELTTHFELHSQTTRLVESISQSTGRHVKYGIVTLFDTLFQGTWTWSSTENASIDYNSDTQGRQITNLSSSLFTRRY